MRCSPWPHCTTAAPSPPSPGWFDSKEGPRIPPHTQDDRWCLPQVESSENVLISLSSWPGLLHLHRALGSLAGQQSHHHQGGQGAEKYPEHFEPGQNIFKAWTVKSRGWLEFCRNEIQSTVDDVTVKYPRRHPSQVLPRLTYNFTSKDFQKFLITSLSTNLGSFY